MSFRVHLKMFAMAMSLAKLVTILCEVLDELPSVDTWTFIKWAFLFRFICFIYLLYKYKHIFYSSITMVSIITYHIIIRDCFISCFIIFYFLFSIIPNPFRQKPFLASFFFHFPSVISFYTPLRV